MKTIQDLEANLVASSKAAVVAVAKRLEENPSLVDDLFMLAISNKQPLAWRAAWVFSHMADYKSPLLPPLLPQIIKALLRIENQSQRGCFLRVLTRTDFMVDEYGDLLDFCINILLKPSNHPSHKFYCLDMLEKYAIQVPDLKQELIMVVEESLQNFETEVLRRKGRRWLKKFRVV